MNLQSTERDDVIAIVIEGDIEMTTMKGLKEELLTIAREKEKDLVIDFEKVLYLDSSGIGVLIAISKILKEKGKSLRLINLTGAISRVLELSSLADMIE